MLIVAVSRDDKVASPTAQGARDEDDVKSRVFNQLGWMPAEVVMRQPILHPTSTLQGRNNIAYAFHPKYLERLRRRKRLRREAEERRSGGLDVVREALA